MTNDKFFEDLALIPDYLPVTDVFLFLLFLRLPLLLIIPVVVTAVRITVVFVVLFVFVAVVAPWPEYQRAGLKIMKMWPIQPRNHDNLGEVDNDLIE